MYLKVIEDIRSHGFLILSGLDIIVFYYAAITQQFYSSSSSNVLRQSSENAYHTPEILISILDVIQGSSKSIKVTNLTHDTINLPNSQHL
jgi:hypothetical protein